MSSSVGNRDKQSTRNSGRKTLSSKPVRQNVATKIATIEKIPRKGQHKHPLGLPRFLYVKAVVESGVLKIPKNGSGQAEKFLQAATSWTKLMYALLHGVPASSVPVKLTTSLPTLRHRLSSYLNEAKTALQPDRNDPSIAINKDLRDEFHNYHPSLDPSEWTNLIANSERQIQAAEAVTGRAGHFFVDDKPNNASEAMQQKQPAEAPRRKQAASSRDTTTAPPHTDQPAPTPNSSARAARERRRSAETLSTTVAVPRGKRIEREVRQDSVQEDEEKDSKKRRLEKSGLEDRGFQIIQQIVEDSARKTRLLEEMFAFVKANMSKPAE